MKDEAAGAIDQRVTGPTRWIPWAGSLAVHGLLLAGLACLPLATTFTRRPVTIRLVLVHTAVHPRQAVAAKLRRDLQSRRSLEAEVRRPEGDSAGVALPLHLPKRLRLARPAVSSDSNGRDAGGSRSKPPVGKRTGDGPAAGMIVAQGAALPVGDDQLAGVGGDSPLTPNNGGRSPLTPNNGGTGLLPLSNDMANREGRRQKDGVAGPTAVKVDLDDSRTSITGATESGPVAEATRLTGRVGGVGVESAAGDARLAGSLKLAGASPSPRNTRLAAASSDAPPGRPRGGGGTAVGYREAPEPVYPEGARERGEEGTVLVRVLVGADGRLLEASVATSSGHPDLDRAAVEAVGRTRFRPATRAGAAVTASAVIPVRFRLE